MKTLEEASADLRAALSDLARHLLAPLQRLALWQLYALLALCFAFFAVLSLIARDPGPLFLGCVAWYVGKLFARGSGKP